MAFWLSPAQRLSSHHALACSLIVCSDCLLHWWYSRLDTLPFPVHASLILIFAWILNVVVWCTGQCGLSKPAMLQAVLNQIEGLGWLAFSAMWRWSSKPLWTICAGMGRLDQILWPHWGWPCMPAFICCGARAWGLPQRCKVTLSHWNPYFLTRTQTFKCRLSPFLEEQTGAAFGVTTHVSPPRVPRPLCLQHEDGVRLRFMVHAPWSSFILFLLVCQYAGV